MDPLLFEYSIAHDALRGRNGAPRTSSEQTEELTLC